MISVTILTKNCQETLEETLKSLASFDEVLILDSGSTDRTIEIASAFANVRIVMETFQGFGKTHNLASSLAKHDWILSIDSDEVLSLALIKEIANLSLDSSCVYTVQRHNYYNGKHMKCCAGWHPDWVVRLYHRKKTSFCDAEVHEKIMSDGFKTIRLSSPLIHTPFRRIEDFISKIQTYSSLFAKQNIHKPPVSMMTVMFRSWFAFFKSYILKRGFLGGKEGFIISAYNAHTTFYKYLKQQDRAPETDCVKE